MSHTQPEPGSGFRTQNIDPGGVPRLVAALDMQETNPGVRRLRAWAHEALAPRTGERALDIGSGTGSTTRELAAAVGPTGSALGVEPNPGLRTIAQERAAEAGNAARFTDGDALSLPVPDASVDVVWCERVLQHLAEPDKAVAEMARVLRPGGRVALLDTDWATTILHPGDPEIMAALTSGALTGAANPYAGRRLVGQLSAAGLVVGDRGLAGAAPGPPLGRLAPDPHARRVRRPPRRPHRGPARPRLRRPHRGRRTGRAAHVRDDVRGRRPPPGVTAGR